MSSFHVRRISQHAPNQSQKPRQSLTIEPTKIIFETHDQTNKINIAKVLLTNTSNAELEYQIKQPRENFFKVKYNRTTLEVNESIEIFVFFNFETSVNQCDIFDQFVILVNGSHVYTVTVPIFVRTYQQKRLEVSRKHRKESMTKENFRMMKLSNQIRTAGEKRCAGIAIPHKRVKYGDETVETVTFKSRIEKFQQDFQNIKNFLKSKAIKCEIYIGQKPFTREKSYDIISFNLTTELMAKEIMKQKILSLHVTKKSKNGPSIRNFDGIKLQWNKSRNQPQITYQKARQKLFKQVRSFVIYHRFKKMNKILTIYRNLRHEENIQQPQTKIINNKFDVNVEESKVESLQVNENSEDRQYEIEIEEKKKHDYYCRKISKIITTKKERNLGADFAQFTLTPTILPIHNESQKNQQFEIKPRIGFDNWVSLEELAPYDHELMKFEKIEGIRKWECHPLYEFNNHNHHTSKDKVKKETRPQIEEVLPLKSSKKQGLTQEGAFLWQNRADFMENYLGNDRKFCNYFKEQNEINFLCNQQQRLMELDARKPCKQNLKAIHELKIAKQEYFPYFCTPQPSIASSFINQSHLPDLIYHIKKEDKINFDQQQPIVINKMESIIRNEISLQDGSKGSQRNRAQAQKQQNQRYPLSTAIEQHSLYERIMQNITKTKIRKLNKVDSKIVSINGFVKNQANHIYL